MNRNVVDEMYVVECSNGKNHKVVIERLTLKELGNLSKARYFFNWKTEQKNEVYKLTIEGSEDILGLLSLIVHEEEKRIEINLLAVSKENRGKNKVYERIAGNLIAWACIVAVKRFGEDACVSLVPKTDLIKHYMNAYGMMNAGRSLYLSDESLLNLIDTYNA